MPLISVIIPTFNRAHVLERAVRSVLSQTFLDYELVVVDDGSTDSTRQVLSRFEPRVRVVTQQNRGPSAARNRGVAASSGPLLAFLDSDDEWMPSKLQRQVERFGAGRDDFVCHTDEIWLREGKRIPQKPIHRKQGGCFFERALERCLISPSAVMVSRQLFDRVGGFDEGLPAAEDYDLWLRITAFHEVSFIAEPLVLKHGGAPDQLSRTVPAIDRFRIQAIRKVLEHPELRDEYRTAATHELVRKCRIVAAGCRKRGKNGEAATYLELARAYDSSHGEST